MPSSLKINPMAAFHLRLGGTMIKALSEQISRRTFARRMGATMAATSLSGSTLKTEGKAAEPPVTFSTKPKPALQTKHLTIGCLVYPRQDQVDFTGPFDVLARIPNSTVHVIGKTTAPVRDMKGL